MERIQKIIASSGFCSRRKAEEYIKKGKVYLNGDKVTELGTKANYNDEIIVDGNLVSFKEEKEYYLLYKPEKTICSVKDEHGRKTVTDLIDTDKRIYPVGRLDYDTSGLLILTNDGELANILMHPSSNIEKVYLAKIKGTISDEKLKEIKKGIAVDGRKVKVTYLKVKNINANNTSSNIYIGITEGRNHIVKKIFGRMDIKVMQLKRVSFAFLTLDGLNKGDYRKLSIKEVKKLYALK